MSERFTSTPYTHADTNKIGVLITNLGTPDEATPRALRRYLAEFLSDPRVVEIPRIIWKLILHGVILRIRPARSAMAYQTVWTERGSPLLFHTQDQSDKLRKALQSQLGEGVLVDFAMRYGNPSIKSKLSDLFSNGARKLIVLPLYPQYSAATTASTFDAIADDFNKRRWIPDFRFVASYHTHPSYIKALAKSVTDFWEKHDRPERLVFSYHGVPLRYLQKGDPYHCQCLATTRLVEEALNLPEGLAITTFQSRFGRAKWLHPYTDKTLQKLGADGVKNIHVICPGFSSDCLETIEEIGEENHDYFMEAGGEKFEYIPALNATDAHVNVLEELVMENIQGWSVPEAQKESEEAKKRNQRFNACPHNKD